ncbi:MAG: selenocysteine-specific translation elongation factor [Armatimonadetes bacterium]|nr:selenocysteine-specific translation elongation factor [Armatimonadota bacterium]
MTDHAIIGTAGHIDHGKTALTKALTGFDTDTLAEEKRRGITIELGFAFMETPGFDKQVIFIDVPGHEKLIKTMVAGASNLDAALLVVAADEGINVQTREHFDILRLLDIAHGVVALTKSDLVDEDRIAAVTAEVQNLVAGSFLENAPIIPVSAITMQGLDELKAAIVDAARKVQKRADSGIFRMPVDRVFTMHGFGTVVAGTILSGEVKLGDKLEVLPDGIVSRVRGIQVHGQSVQRSEIGKRTAINLQDIKKDQLRRGQVVCAPGSLKPSSRMDIRLQVLENYPEELKNRIRVRFHVGTDEVMARLLLLDCDKVQPGDTALAQLVLESPTVALPKDRFVIRAFSSMQTIGGGAILDAHPVHHKRFDEAILDSLEKRQGDLCDVLEQAFTKSGSDPLSITDAAAAIGESEEDVLKAVDELSASGEIKRITPRNLENVPRDPSRETYIHAKIFDDLTQKLIVIMKEFFAKNPYKLYMGPADLQSRFMKLARRPVYEAVMIELRQAGKLIWKDGRVTLSDREIQFRVGERQLAERIERQYDESGFSSPPEYEVFDSLRITPDTFENIITALIEQGKLIRLGEKVTYHTKHLKATKQIVADLITKHNGISAAELRDSLGVTRKYAVAILEYFDDQQFTKRVGEKRVLK